MPVRVQSYPVGLTQILQLKGQEPFSCTEEFRPTFDVINALAAARYEKVDAAASIASQSTQTLLTVPADQVWVVTSVSARLTASSSGDELKTQILIRGLSGGFVAVAESEKITASASNERASSFYNPGYPLILPAGCQIAAFAEVFLPTAGTRVQTIEAFISRFGANT